MQTAKGIWPLYREPGLMPGFFVFQPSRRFSWMALISPRNTSMSLLIIWSPLSGAIEMPSPQHFDVACGTRRPYAGFRISPCCTSAVCATWCGHKTSIDRAKARHPPPLPSPNRQYRAEPTQANRQVINDAILHLEGTRWQYVADVSNPELIAPEGYYLDAFLLERPGNKDIQLDLFYDYQNNLQLYPAFQQFFRDTQVPTLAIWGKGDPFFIPPGAEAYKRDNPNAVVELLDTGHFALETHAEHIAQRIGEVVGSHIN